MGGNQTNHTIHNLHEANSAVVAGKSGKGHRERHPLAILWARETAGRPDSHAEETGKGKQRMATTSSHHQTRLSTAYTRRQWEQSSSRGWGKQEGIGKHGYGSM